MPKKKNVVVGVALDTPVKSDAPAIAFVIACKQKFGFRPGQSGLVDFRNEIHELTQKDCEDLIGEFAKDGIKVDMPSWLGKQA